MFVLCAVFIAYIYTPGSVASSVYTKSAMFAFGAHFVQVQLRMLVSSVLADLFNPYRRTILIGWALMAVNALHLLIYGQALINEGLMFLLVSAISCAAIAHFIYHMLHEFCSILDIYVFTIKHKFVPESVKTK